MILVCGAGRKEKKERGRPPSLSLTQRERGGGRSSFDDDDDDDDDDTARRRSETTNAKNNSSRTRSRREDPCKLCKHRLARCGSLVPYNNINTRLVPAASLELCLLLVLIVRILLGPRKRVGEHKPVPQHVKQRLGRPRVDVLRLVVVEPSDQPRRRLVWRIVSGERTKGQRE